MMSNKEETKSNKRGPQPSTDVVIHYVTGELITLRLLDVQGVGTGCGPDTDHDEALWKSGRLVLRRPLGDLRDLFPKVEDAGDVEFPDEEGSTTGVE